MIATTAKYIQDDHDFEEIFDVFEYLISVIYADHRERTVSKDWGFAAPLGLFALRYWSIYGTLTRSTPPWDAVVQGILSGGPEAAILRSGFFDASRDRFKEMIERHDTWGKTHTASQPWA